MPTERLPGANERTLDAPVLKFDLTSVVRGLQSERTWETGSRNAITLLKAKELRVVCVAMHVGAEVPWQRSDAAMTIHVLSGVLAFSTEVEGTESVERLGPGQLLALQAGVAHRLQAIDEPCDVLLTLVSEKPHAAE
jgi:quercetin dioxygenase-like cupin family protein